MLVVVAAVLAGPAITSVVVVPAAGAATTGCRVDYAIRSQSAAKFITDVSINNLGDPWYAGWRLDWVFPDAGQQIARLWNGTYTQVGDRVSVVNAAYNGNVAGGASVTFGFSGTYTAGNPVPAAFSVNGVACTGEVTGGGVDVATVSVALNLYNQAGVDQVLDPQGLRPLLRPDDVFVLVSGNSTGSPDPTWISTAAAALHDAFPGMEIRVLTSGQANIQQVVQARDQIPGYIQALGYDYEPNRANEPEFTWDFPTTTGNFATAAGQAQAGGFRLFGAPTGRALLQTSLLSYGWNYASLVVSDAGQITQLQTYCKTSTDQYLAAVTKLRDEATAAGVPLDRFFPQVTVDSDATPNVNGVSPTQARDCAERAADQGFSRLSLWWGADTPADAKQFLQLLGR